MNGCLTFKPELNPSFSALANASSVVPVLPQSFLNFLNSSLFIKFLLSWWSTDKAIKLAPKIVSGLVVKTLILLSESYEKIGRYKQALNSLNKIFDLRVDKYSDLVLIKKAIIYRNIGMKHRSQEIFQIILSDYPDSKYIAFAEYEIKNI